MKLQGRGLYNLLRLNSQVDPDLKVENWQVLNYRDLSVQELFNRLKKVNILVDEQSFKLYAEECSSPEELTEYLWIDDKDLKGEEKAYLLIFELWRKLLPEKPCISIFCDELDYLIELYDEKKLSDINKLIDHLSELENILDEHVDQGSSLDDVFSAICEYCAHDIENFLYDFIFDLINAGDSMTASELIDGFYEYVREKRWFDLLQAELMFTADPEEASLMLRRIAETLKENPDPQLHFDVLYVASKHAESSLFKEIFFDLFLIIELEEELLELLNILLEFIRLQDQDHLSQEIEQLLHHRKEKTPSQKLSDKAVLKEKLEPVLQNL